MTSKWSKSEEKSTEALKSSYLINYCGEIFITDATEKEIEKNIKEWGPKKLSKRSKVRKSKDAKIYNKTARKTKAINLGSGAIRGGIRL